MAMLGLTYSLLTLLHRHSVAYEDVDAQLFDLQGEQSPGQPSARNELRRSLLSWQRRQASPEALCGDYGTDCSIHDHPVTHPRDSEASQATPRATLQLTWNCSGALLSNQYIMPSLRALQFPHILLCRWI